AGEVEHAAGAERVQVQGQVQAFIENDNGGGVDDDLRFLGEAAEVIIADAETFVGQVAGDDRDALIDVVIEAFAELALEVVEDTGLEQLSAEAVGGGDGAGAALPRGGEEGEGGGGGGAAEHLLEEGLAEEAGGAGDEDSFPGKVSLNSTHAVLFTESIPCGRGAWESFQKGAKTATALHRAGPLHQPLPVQPPPAEGLLPFA